MCSGNRSILINDPSLSPEAAGLGSERVRANGDRWAGGDGTRRKRTNALSASFTTTEEKFFADEHLFDDDDDDKNGAGSRMERKHRRRRRDGEVTAGPWPEDPPLQFPSSSSSSSRQRLCVASVAARIRESVRLWTYGYMDSILRKGAQQKFGDGDQGEAARHNQLSAEDLYSVPRSMEAEVLHRKFITIYSEENQRLFRSLWRIASPTFIPAGFCQLLTVVAQVSIPVLVWQLLRTLESPGNVYADSVLYVVLLFAASAVNALALHRQRHLAMKSGIAIRAALVAAIYGHALHLTPAGRMGLTTGEITNLVAIDSHKLYDVAQEGHLLWSCPLSMILVALVLVAIMGPPMLVGMGIMFAFVPVVQCFAKRMMKYRKERVEVTDRRVEVVTAMLQGIRVTKLNNFESRYLERIERAREEELCLLRKDLNTWAWTMALQFICPILGSGAAIVAYVLVDESHILRTSDTFTVLLLFTALRFPINYTGRLVGKAAQALDSSRRIAAFLSRESRADDSLGWGDGAPKEGADFSKTKGVNESETVSSSSSQVSVVNGVFHVGGGLPSSSSDAADAASWGELEAGEGRDGFTLSGVQFSVSRGEVLAVIGPVGAGKSVLVNGLIGEALCSPSSTVDARGKITYAGQVPFVLNATFRENILFGCSFDRDRYERTIEACCLCPDIEQLGAAGDLTEIGERGVTLSGGQKQRISLARVVYSAPDVALFDDPLSALDAGTSRKIFDQVFNLTGEGLLSSTAVILVTHAAQFLQRVDRILAIVEGKQQFLGTWSDFSGFTSDDCATKALVESMQAAVQEGSSSNTDQGGAGAVESPAGEPVTSTEVPKQKDELDQKSGILISAEQREYGVSKFTTWLSWYRYAGGVSFTVVLVILYTMQKCTYFMIDLWYTVWTRAGTEPIEVFGIVFPPQSNGRQAQSSYLAVYAVIFVAAFFVASVRSHWLVRGGLKCSRRMFQKMTLRILHAPTSFFETTPMGRILNRFTYDMESLDMNLTVSMTWLTLGISWFIAALVIMMVLLPWMILALVPITLLYFILQLHYRKTGADLQRLDAISRSPVQAMLAEGVDGSLTIHAFHKEEHFLGLFHNQQDRNNSALINFISAQRWLGVRTELLGAVVTFVACVLVVVMNQTVGLGGGRTALLVTWSTAFTTIMSLMVDLVAETEAAITSVERIESMFEIPQEKEMETQKHISLIEEWPSRGSLEFDGVHLRYREGLPLALDNLSFQVPPGKRCGVVGRTGAGKSTLTTALFRLTEVESGKIFLDGVDLSTLGLSDVRGRPNGMTIIPQDPVLFSGTLRECIDPFEGFKDDEILCALQAVRLMDPERGSDVLKDRVEEGGANFSVGERQLLFLARAILVQPKLLVLDEATASVDEETDAFIQEMLRIRFSGTTLLCIAHRLQTIMDFDLVLVMADGRAVEFGSPKSLLTSGGFFSELVHATGKENAETLTKMAKH